MTETEKLVDRLKTAHINARGRIIGADIFEEGATQTALAATPAGGVG